MTPVLRYPCWICGTLIVAEDRYDVCGVCLLRLELSREPESPPRPQEVIDAELRRLLDDW
jgi:hypothetical protein